MPILVLNWKTEVTLMVSQTLIRLESLRGIEEACIAELVPHLLVSKLPLKVYIYHSQSDSLCGVHWPFIAVRLRV